MNFLLKHSFLIFSGIIAVSALILFKMTSGFIDGEYLSSNIIFSQEIDSASLSLSTQDNDLLLRELLIVDVALDDDVVLTEGSLRLNYSGKLLDLVRVSARESVMNLETVGMATTISKDYHGATIAFENTALNGSKVLKGDLMKLYFVAQDIGEGKVVIDSTKSNVQDRGKMGPILSNSDISFRIE